LIGADDSTGGSLTEERHGFLISVQRQKGIWSDDRLLF